MFETFSATIAKGLASLAKKEASDFLQNLLTNMRAEKFAMEQLRSKYESRVQPAVYEHVVSNFRLEPQDIANYFKIAETPSLTSLRTYLRSQLRIRASNWVHNTPTEKLFEEMVNDFYHAYEVFFLTTDPNFVSLELFGASQEILSLVQEIRSSLPTNEQVKNQNKFSLFEELRLLLTTLQLPFDVLERTSKQADIKMIDISGMFPAEILICANGNSPSPDIVDGVSDRAKKYGRFSHIFLITYNTPDSQTLEYGNRRSMSVLPFQEFREQLLRLTPSEQYILGPTPIAALLDL